MSSDSRDVDSTSIGPTRTTGEQRRRAALYVAAKTEDDVQARAELLAALGLVDHQGRRTW